MKDFCDEEIMSLTPKPSNKGKSRTRGPPKDFKSISNRVDIVKDIQFKPFKSDQPFGGPGAHNGGRIRIGPDGYLWVGTGDRHWGPGPQDKNAIAGKVLRIDGDGNAHPGNKINGDKSNGLICKSNHKSYGQ